jgi:hypothetical protein
VEYQEADVESVCFAELVGRAVLIRRGSRFGKL